MYPWVVFHFPDQRPVGFAAIHLRTGATMDSKFLNTAVLKSKSKFDNKEPLPTPPLKGGSFESQGIDTG